MLQSSRLQRVGRDLATESCHDVTGCRPSKNVQVFIVQSLSHVQLFVTLWTATRQVSLSFTISWSLLKLMSVEAVMSSNHLILCHLLLLLPSIFPRIKVFSNELTLCIRWPEYWHFAISHSMNIQGWFPLGLTGLISLQSKGLSRVFSNITAQKY